MNKRLVFNFYIFPEWEDNEVNQIHLKCLSKEIHNFNKATFVIMIDDINNIELINSFEKTIIGMNFKGDLTFKIAENNDFRESSTFYNEIICKNEDELVFFGHNKGITNILKYKKENIYNWIVGMYFFNFYDIKDVEEKLISKKGISYGAYLTCNDDEYNTIKYHWSYIGTFYWVNNSKLKLFFDNNDVKLPPLCDRFYDEELFGNIFPFYNFPYASNLTNTCLINAFDFYHHSTYYTDMLLSNDERKNAFNEYYNYALSGIKKKYKYTILTFNFNNYEIMREVNNKQDDVEYIYITDDENTVSTTWKVVVVKDLEGLTPFEKSMEVRYNPFKYCSTDTCVILNAAIQIYGSIDYIVEEFEKRETDLATLIHPERSTFEEEYDAWERIRKGEVEYNERNVVLDFLKENNYDVNYKGLYENGFIICRNNSLITEFFKECLGLIYYFKNKGVNIRIDQILYSYILNKNQNLKILPLNHDCIQNPKTLLNMWHGTDKYTCEIKNVPEDGYLFNEKIKLFKY